MITSIINAAAAATNALTAKSTTARQQAESLPLPIQKNVSEPLRRKCKRDWLEDAMQCEEHAALA